VSAAASSRVVSRDDVTASVAANPLASYRRFVIEAWASHIAVSVGLFQALAVPRSLDAIVDECGWDSSALRALLRALVACGHIVEDTQGRFHLSERSRALFLPGSDEYIGHALSFVQTAASYARYPQILRGDPAVGLTESQWSYVTRGSAIYAPAGIELLLAKFARLWSRDTLRILDVGCGQGAYLLRLARALPHARILGIDPTPSVVAEATTRLREIGARAPEVRVARLEDVTEQFDVILFNQVFHVTGIQAAEQMLTLARARLSAGGHVFVQEILDDGGDPMPALFGLNMRLLFERGCALTVTEQVELLERAGFVQVEVHPIEHATTPGLAYVSGQIEEHRAP
jgi:cyclopropane fatty-acyl-phospholipid synthase-like methyltransferase